MADESPNQSDSTSNDQTSFYAVLNVPRHANADLIQRNFKQLSRVYHPDKCSSLSSGGEQPNQTWVAQQSFVQIKTAQDVLTDPVLRLAYDCGGVTAVTLIKRSQAARHSDEAVAAADERNDDDDDDDDVEMDLYSTIEQALKNGGPQEAAHVVHSFLQEYRLQKEQSVLSKQDFRCSCDMPHVYKQQQQQQHLQQESCSLNVRSSFPLHSKLSASVGGRSEVEHTAAANISSTCGLDYQPVPGTHVACDVSLNHAAAATARKTTNSSSTTTTTSNSAAAPPVGLSLRTTRQSAAGTVLVAAIGGSTKSRSTWNASLVSYRTVLYKETTKLHASWRIGFSPAGQLRHLAASLRTIEFPVWNCRLGLVTYPVKISWQGKEHDTFYAACAWGFSGLFRLKLLRLKSLGDEWTFKYGLKYDGQALYSTTGGSLWTILCQLESSELSFRIPIHLNSIHPVAWIASLLVAEFADQTIEGFQRKSRSGIRKDVAAASATSKRSTTTQRCYGATYSGFVAHVAAKKRIQEESSPNGLIILKATRQSGAIQDDVTDVLQFWVANGRLRIYFDESKWLWQKEKKQSKDGETNYSSSTMTWWAYLFAADRKAEAKPLPKQRSELTVRYKFNGIVYEILLDGDRVIDLPNPSATEMGPSDRIR